MNTDGTTESLPSAVDPVARIRLLWEHLAVDKQQRRIDLLTL